MKKQSFWPLLIIPLLLTGCATRQIETSLTPIRPESGDFKGAHVSMEHIRCIISNVPTPAQVGTGYSFEGTTFTPTIVVVPGNAAQTTFLTDIAAERQLYDELENLSNGKISSDSHSEYQIQKIEMLGQFPDQKVGQVVAVRSTSFFIPPMGAIKTDLECHYQIGYILKKDDQFIRKKVLDVLLKGNYSGWYVAGAIQGKRLAQELNATARHEVTIQLLNDIYDTIENDQKLSHL
jgi:hypothetical protein